MVKIDVEGFELEILADLIPLMRRRLIRNIVFELTPGWWPQSRAPNLHGGNGTLQPGNPLLPHVLRAVAQAGYAVRTIHGYAVSLSAVIEDVVRRGEAPGVSRQPAASRNQPTARVGQENIWLSLDG